MFVFYNNFVNNVTRIVWAGGFEYHLFHHFPFIMLLCNSIFLLKMYLFWLIPLFICAISLESAQVYSTMMYSMLSHLLWQGKRERNWEKCVERIQNRNVTVCKLSYFLAKIWVRQLLFLNFICFNIAGKPRELRYCFRQAEKKEINKRRTSSNNWHRNNMESFVLRFANTLYSLYRRSYVYICTQMTIETVAVIAMSFGLSCIIQQDYYWIQLVLSRSAECYVCALFFSLQIFIYTCAATALFTEKIHIKHVLLWCLLSALFR